MTESLQPIAKNVICRAERQGSILPDEVREELRQAGVPEELWKDVLALARPSLIYRDGRYHYHSSVTPRVRDEQTRQDNISKTVRTVIRQHKETTREGDRRQRDRLAFVQPVRILDEAGRSSTLLTRDISATGIRLLGTKHLLGQRLRVYLTDPDDKTESVFDVRILWSCTVADGMIENGGTLLGAASKN